jgi:hypothetical protein
MSGPRTPSDRRRPGQVLATALGVVITVAMGALLLLTIFFPGDSGTVPAPATSIGEASSPAGQRSIELRDLRPSDTSPSARPTVTPALSIRLPAPGGLRFGLPTGFGHSPEGAAATAISFLRSTATWDFDAADRAVRAYTRPIDTETQRTSTRTSISRSRSALKLPASGPVPATARLEATPLGVYWTVVTEDTVDVSVLLRASSSIDGAAPVTQLRNAQYRMTWADGDWRNTPLDPAQATRQPETVEPGTAAFNVQGWRAIA